MPGGIIHVYQRYDPRRFPSPTQPPPDVVSSAFDHLRTFGRHRELTPEELARANVERWIGRNIADMVTVESRPKIAALLDDDTAELRRWRQVNHPLEGASDLPV